MKTIAKLNYLRISPRKVRQISDLIKGMEVIGAENQLNFLSKRSARLLLKLLKSAAANAKNNFDLDKENLFISNILVNQGPSLKRWMPRARGVASPIIKRTSHITLILEEKKKTKIIPKKKIKREKEVAKGKKLEKKERESPKSVARKKPKEKWKKPAKKEKIRLKTKFLPKIFRRKSM